MALRTAKLSGTPTWSDDSNFDGYILIGLNSGQTDAACWLEGSDFRQQLPIFTKVRVANGVIDQAVRLYFTADIQPPNSRYWAWWYDTAGVLIDPAVGDPDAFQVTADPHAITIPTLTAPSAPTTPPSTA